MRRLSLAVLCVLIAVPTYARLVHGIADEELVGDVVVQSVGPYRVVMAIDSAANGRDGGVDEVFAVRSETMFPRPVSVRFDHARVLIRADHLFVISEDGRVVIFTAGAQCDDCEFAPNMHVSRFNGFEIIRLYGERPWPHFKPQKKLGTGQTSLRNGGEPAEPREIVRPGRGHAVAPLDGDWYDPVEYWDPCAPDPWGNVPGICAAGGGSSPKPAKDCEAGGIGSVSCSLTGCQLLFGTTPGCSTSCSAGYYSCCYCDGGQSSCGCYKQ